MSPPSKEDQGVHGDQQLCIPLDALQVDAGVLGHFIPALNLTLSFLSQGGCSPSCVQTHE